MELAPGMLVTDNVRLVRELGVGGMGSVWVAENTSLHTNVAVKFVSAELVEEDSTILERFNREASLSAQIKSPYVVQTYDHGVMDDGRPYIVMELLEGQSLSELLGQRQLGLEEITHIVTQTAKALSKAHQLGIVHRDIKPDNLFLTYEHDELFLKVLDFGIAKQTGLPKASAVTGTGVMIGTPEYMSPEQVLSAKSVDFRSDLWALGVVAYHCITGGVPFTGETLGSLCVAIANGKFEPPSKLRPGLLPTVDAWFDIALAKDPEERFPSAKHMATSFSRALVGEIIEDFSSSGGVDWSGPHAVVSLSTPDARPELASDALAVRPSGATAAAAIRQPSHGRGEPQPGVPTFAGTTVDPDVPTGRTKVAAIAAVAVFGVIGTGVFLASRGDAPQPAAVSTEEPTSSQAAGEAPRSEPTSEVTTEPSAAEAASSADEVATGPSAKASSEQTSPSPHAGPNPLPKPRAIPQPAARPSPQPPEPAPPEPTGDKYGF